MTLLDIVESFCERSNLVVPASIIGTTDTQVKQIKALLEELCISTASRGPWERMTFEATHTTLAAEDQGAMTSIATNGFRYIKNQTIWDRTDDLPVPGPLSPQEWQRLKAISSNTPRY